MTPSQRLRTLLILGLACANILVFALSGYSLYQSRKHYELHAQTLTQNIASALDQNVSDHVEKIDLALRAVADEVERQLAGKGIDEEAMNDFLAKYARRLPEVDGFRVVNADGFVILGKGANKQNRVSSAERDYFIYHRNHADGTLQVSKPFIGSIAKKYLITLTRRYNHQDGSFAGVISAAITLDYFTQNLSRFDLGPKGTLIVRDVDLGLIVRYPPLPDQPAGRVGNNAVSKEFSQLGESGVRSATYHTPSGSDGLERMFTFRRLEGAPMIVNAGVATDDYLADWTAGVYKTSAMAFGFLLMSLLSGVFLLRFLAQVELREQMLSQSEERLNHAQQLAHLGSFDWNLVSGALLWSDEHFRLWGLEPQSVAPSFEGFRQGIHPDDLARTEETLQQALHGGRSYDIVHRVVWSDGSEHYVQGQANVIFDDAGQPVRMIGTVQDITEHRQQEERIRQLLSENETILGNALVGIVYLKQRRIVSCNRRLEEIFRYGPGELIGELSERLYDSHETFEHIGVVAYKAAAEGNSYTGEVRLRHKDGSLFWGTLSGRAVDPAYPHEGSIWIYSDITDRKQTEAELRIAAIAFESQAGMVITDADGVILRVNRAFIETTGYTAEEAVGQTPRLLKSGRHDGAFYAAMWETLLSTGAWQGEIWDRRKSGEVYPNWLTISAVRGHDGAVTHFVAAHNDISQRKAAEDQLHKLAFYDPLTQLPNRRLLLDRLGHALAGSARSLHQGAIMFIDLDNFKTLNDTQGHDVGDRLLAEAAQRLQSSVRQGDTVARLGGDEFVVMLEDLEEESLVAAQVAGVAEKILAALDHTYRLELNTRSGWHNTLDYRCTASIGVTLFGAQGGNVDELLKQADLAMYQAKESGRNTIRFFDPDMQATVSNRVALEAGLREAVQMGQLLLHYQPQLVGEGHRLMGAEALVRWQHPQRGMVPPAEFIPLAEETGLILPLGYWVLKTACAQLAAWAARPEMAHLTVAVNVSAQQFRQVDFVDQVLAVLAGSGANPQRLKLELTESLLVDNVEDIITKMTVLKAKGVGFSLDDFGTGYSSLSYLKRLPLDQLKIDQSFVRDVLTDPNDAAIAKMIVALAESLGLAVIAEGVEIEAQRLFLARHGCHAYQGYLFSKPLSLEDFEEFAQRV